MKKRIYIYYLIFYVIIGFTCTLTACTSNDTQNELENKTDNINQDTINNVEMQYDYTSKDLKETVKTNNFKDILIYDTDNNKLSTYQEASNPKKVHSYKNRFQETGNGYFIDGTRLYEFVDLETGNYYICHHTNYNFNMTPLYDEDGNIKNMYKNNDLKGEEGNVKE